VNSSTAEAAPAVALRSASKNFGHIQALDHADLTAGRGEIHGVVGDNGAGKSTMLKILSGLHRPDSGELRIEGLPVTLHSPLDARSTRTSHSSSASTWRPTFISATSRRNAGW
jgi:rhamnose transport system ATP-binding protein